MDQTFTLGPAPREIFITEEMLSRPPRRTNHLREKQALQDLTSRLVSAPEEVLPLFVERAMELTDGVSAGLSLYEPDPAPVIFRWRHLRGTLAAFENATTPRNFSPCGVTLDQDRPVLTRHSELFYPWIAAVKVALPEVLLVPLHLAGHEPLGTLWIVSDEDNHFDSGDMRAAAELASFAGVAVQMIRGRQKLEHTLEQQETLAKEMSHRVKNLFSIAEGLVRMTARASDSKENMSKALIGRFHALANAHGLVRRAFAVDEKENRVTDFGDLVRAIVKPHQSEESGPLRFAIDGPAIECSPDSINGIALVFHELTTNAAKYGALKDDAGKVPIRWKKDGDKLDVYWMERGGPALAGAPAATGFGSKLLQDMVARQFNGTVQNQWNPEGLEVRMAIPVASITH